MERFDRVRERASGIDVDVQELIDRERDEWERLQ